MISSLALIFLLGISLSGILAKFKVPNIVGLILTGVILGPSVLDLLDPAFLAFADDFQEIALIIILTNAGLHLDLQQLKEIGRPAFLMSTLPTIFVLIGAVILGPLFFGADIIDSLIIGAILGPVTPSILIPKMIELIVQKRGTKHNIPQILIAGSSVDDILGIVLFSCFVLLKQTGEFHPEDLMKIPISLITGIIGGFIAGYLMEYIFLKTHIRDTIKLIIILSVSSLLVSFETIIESYFAFSGLLACMTAAVVINSLDHTRAARLTGKFNKLWVGAELWVFSLVGAIMPLDNSIKYAIYISVFIILVMLIRSIGVVLALSKTSSNNKEKLFAVFAELPKGTVQAAIGGIPLSLGLLNGELILSISVISIILTAPLGSILIDKTKYILLDKEE